MSQQDRTSTIVVNHRTIKQVVDWLLVPALFAGMRTRVGATWKARMLAVTALLWACSDLDNLTDRFTQARKITTRVFRWQLAPGETYQGFVKMLRKWHLELMLVIPPKVRVLMCEVLSGQWKIAGYVVFAGDGSRVELARTRSNEKAYSPKKKQKKRKGKKKRKNFSQNRGRRGRGAKKKSQSAKSVEKKVNSPQMWLTLLWHVGTGLPWDWKTGPSDSSERGHLVEMLPKLPKNSLITADAGFVGYDFWKTVLDSGQNLLVRVGGNVTLVKELGWARQHEHTVFLWPDFAAKKKQPPLVLRLIVVHNGRNPVYLVTNLNKSQLSDRQAAKIYARRWGIELFFRTFKQTFGRRKLRSHSAENVKLEVDWSLLGLWCICLLGQRELAASGENPTSLSAAAAIKTLQATLREWRLRPETIHDSLWNLLRVAILDNYERRSSKTSRDYPRKKKRTKKMGPPEIIRANKQQIQTAKQLKLNQRDFRLTA